MHGHDGQVTHYDNFRQFFCQNKNGKKITIVADTFIAGHIYPPWTQQSRGGPALIDYAITLTIVKREKQQE